MSPGGHRVSKVRVLKGEQVFVVDCAKNLLTQCIDHRDMEGNLDEQRVVQAVGFGDLGSGGVGLVFGLGSGVDGLIVGHSRNDEIFCSGHDECQMTVVTPAEEGGDGLGIGVELFLESADAGIRRFASDDGELRMGEG
jgi:hypothetical protein